MDLCGSDETHRVERFINDCYRPLDVQGGQINASGGLCIAGDCKTAWSQVGGGAGGWTDGGTNVYLTTTGDNVGIGTTTPGEKFEVVDSGSSYQRIANFYNTNVAGIPYITVSKQSAEGAGTGVVLAYDTANDRGWLGLAGGTLGTGLNWNSSGNVGVGTAAPAVKLDSVGAVRNSAPSAGYLELSGLLPGYLDNTYPTLKTNGSWLYFAAGGSYIGHWNSTGLRASVFYDFNSESYYVDPAGNSVMNTINSGTPITSANIGSQTVAGVPWSGVTGKPSLIADGGTWTSGPYTNDWFRVNGNNGIYWSTWGGGWYMSDTTWVRAYNSKSVWTPGTMQADSNMYTPILYDLNNSAYYIDPATTSITNDMRANIFYDQGNTGYYVDPASTSITNDFRANIFYDQGNTGYYVDPASTTRLNQIFMGGGSAQGSIYVGTGAGRITAEGGDGSYGQIQVGNNSIGSEATIGFARGVSSYGALSSSMGAGGVYYVGAGTCGAGNAWVICGGVNGNIRQSWTAIDGKKYAENTPGNILFTMDPRGHLAVAGRYGSAGADYAEAVEPVAGTKKSDYEAGDVLCVQGGDRYGKCGEPYSAMLAGAVSESPAVVGNLNGMTEGDRAKEEAKRIFMAFVGRIRVKVTSDNGPIKIGDYLAAAGRAGYAMKATEPGMVLGKALEDFDGKDGKILILLQPTYWSPN